MRLENIKSHNLCTKQQPPFGYEYLLGLGLKFCPSLEAPPSTLSQSVRRFKRAIRIRDYRHVAQLRNLDAAQEDEGYNPKIYIPSSWDPPEASPAVEECLEKFEKNLQQLCENKRKKWTGWKNLSRRQRYLLSYLRNHPTFIVCDSDKNLGAVIMEREEYILRTLRDHLLHTETYKRLETGEIMHREEVIRTKLRKMLAQAKTRKLLKPNECTYLHRALETCNRIPQFYITLKLHKKELASRPVTGTGGSLLAAVSKLVDFYLQPVAPASTCYLRDWEHLVDQIHDLGELPHDAKLFTADATSMYTNIDTTHGLEILRKWLERLKEKGQLSSTFPIDFIVRLSELVMRNNHFMFGNTEWLQLTGTAMGTPMACIYATIYYAWKEMRDILPRFEVNLPLLGRFIDDFAGIWTRGAGNTFEDFITCLQEYGPGMLKWEVSDLADSVDMLDLTLTITGSKIQTRTYQKELNLYAYVPRHSAHPPGLLRALVVSQLVRYHRQCTDINDYAYFAALLLTRLQARGYAFDDIKRYFLEAATRIDNYDSRNTTIPPNKSRRGRTIPKSTQIFHLEYHVGGANNREIHEAFARTCNFGTQQSSKSARNPYRRGTANAQHLGIERLLVARSRPRNLRDYLVPSTLHQNDGKPVSKYVESERSS